MSACSRLEEDERGRVSWLMDDVSMPFTAYRRWGREHLDAGMVGLTFSCPTPNR